MYNKNRREKSCWMEKVVCCCSTFPCQWSSVSHWTRSLGYEFPGNSAQQFVLDAVMKRMILILLHLNPSTVPGQLNATHIDEVNVFCCSLFKISSLIFGPFWMACDLQMLQISNDPDCVFSFWVGMPYRRYSASNSLSSGCSTSSCSTLTSITIFRDHKWPTPDEGTFTYQSPNLTFDKFNWHDFACSFEKARWIQLCGKKSMGFHRSCEFYNVWFKREEVRVGVFTLNIWIKSLIFKRR
jgi:hypothetical protein